MDDETMTIDVSVQAKKPRKKNGVGKKAVTGFTDHVEIRAVDLKYFLGTWVRYTNLDTGENFSGGNLREINSSSVVLQAPFLSTDVTIPVRGHSFFCHNTLPQYSSLLLIKRDMDQNRFERQRLKRLEKELLSERKGET